MAITTEEIGRRIRENRRSAGLTQEQLASRLNVSFQAVSSWERGEYVPDTWNLIELARALNVSVSSLVEDRFGYAFTTDKIFYDPEHMHTFISATAKAKKMKNTMAALPYAKQAHKGQKLKNAEDIPYVSHPLNMACHLLAMGIDDDVVIAATLLHDVIEDCGKSAAELPVDEETREIVSLLSHTKDYEDREAMLKRYYAGIRKSPKASLIKLVDRCNNLTKMSWGLSRERIYRMIDETQRYVLPLLKVIKNTEFDNAKWLLSYQIETTLDIYKRLM